MSQPKIEHDIALKNLRELEKEGMLPSVVDAHLKMIARNRGVTFEELKGVYQQMDIIGWLQGYKGTSR